MLKSALYALAAMAFAGAASATTITVTYSEDFAEKLVEDYGEREGSTLSDYVARHLESALEDEGVVPAAITVTIIDAVPNRPTLEQASARPGLDTFRSFGIGGMELEGVAYDEAGNEIGRYEYDWYERDIRQSQGVGTWWDARRASRRFASRFAETLAE